ncbi:ribosomal-protein-alanine N-acetyltransferase [Paenibacillus forsythiae]|uniref:Ribosomal-protein-alanine N-acetyltransferase n=1 Tax=Paenibacillus forsythiae TaxID=365616 RepID=A0ABU3HCK6_9BACL|nr:GNAT family protein [Paenibacillus forsythiae]MDT3428465.1 ribosomal-protein-alanine N-acetyltransferase [Paenibacillus forsythiae]
MEEHSRIAPGLTGRRLRLRAMRWEDADALLRCWSHPESAYWLGIRPLTSREDAEELIRLLLEMERGEESLRWSIELSGGEVIGSCGYNNWQLQGAFRGEVGCELSPAFRGRGYMREALALALCYGFEEMGLNRVEAQCHPANLRSGRLLASLGFRREGTLREYRHTPSGFQDVDLYALLRREWRDYITLEREGS